MVLFHWKNSQNLSDTTVSSGSVDLSLNRCSNFSFSFLNIVILKFKKQMYSFVYLDSSDQLKAVNSTACTLERN